MSNPRLRASRFRIRAAIFAAFAALAFGAECRAAALSAAEYKGELEKISAALEAKNLTGAQKLAAELEGKRIVSQEGEFAADSSLLRPLQKVQTLKEAGKYNARLNVLVSALVETGSAETMPETPSPRTDLLDRFRRDEAISLPPRDGELPDTGVTQSSTWRAIREFIEDCFIAVKDVWNRFWKWVNNLFPKSAGSGWIDTGAFVKVLIVVFALVAIGLVAYILRRNNPLGKKFSTSSAMPAAAPKDADPTSRDAAEWEDYALKLAAAGRHREAIRAWYHALLVTHFRAGLLHYRKGRTNWEYCYALPHDIPWRQRFQELTGFFEVEWYGKFQSEPGDAGTYSAAAKQVLGQVLRGQGGNELAA